MSKLFLLFLLGVLNALSQHAPTKIYSVHYNGAEVIDPLLPPISYASNLQVADVNANPVTLYFLSDKQTPNLKYAQFNPNASVGQNHSFWLFTNSPLTNSQNPQPFVSLSVVGNNMIGASYPTRNASTESPTFDIQSIYINPTTGEVTNTQNQYPGFTFLNFLIDPVTEPTGRTYVYTVGWGSKGLYAARGFIYANGTGSNAFSLNPNTDALSLNNSCFDTYNELLMPKLYLTATYLLVAVPGRCANFFKITLPTDPVPFSGAQFVPERVVDSVDKYISGLDFDADGEIIHFTMKSYDSVDVTLMGFNTDSWKASSLFLNLQMPESEALLTVANERINGNTVRYLFVAATGSDKIQRFTVTDSAYTYHTSATIDNELNSVSSMIYIRPYLYFTTYEADSKIARISKSSFCSINCGHFAFCSQGVCQCDAGFALDPANVTAGCQPYAYIIIKGGENQSQGAAAAFGVLFAFALIAAIAGWYMWHRKRNS